MNPLFLITRREPADDWLAQEAQDMGFIVVREPLLETEPGTDARWLAQHLAEIPEGAGLTWTSRRAAEALVKALPPGGGKLKGVPMYAVGEESAAPLRRSGFSPLVPAEPLGAAELARFIAARAVEDRVTRVVFLHGDRSLSDLPDGLRDRGIEVEFLQVYRTRFLSPDLGGLESALREGISVIAAFFSPSGVEGFERLLAPDSLALARERAAAIARGPTTAEALRQRGYRNVLGFEAASPFSRYAQQALHTTPGGRP